MVTLHFLLHKTDKRNIILLKRSNDQIKSQPFDHPNHFRSKSYPHSTLEVTIKNGFFDHRHNQDSEAKAKKSQLYS